MFIDPPRRPGRTRYFVTLCFPLDEWERWERACKTFDLVPHLHLREILDPVFQSNLKHLSGEAAKPGASR